MTSKIAFALLPQPVMGRAPAAFQARAEALSEFRINKNRWPSAVATDVSERTLGEWLHNQRKYYKTGSNPAFTTERAAHLDAAATGWRGGSRPRGEAAFEDSAQALGGFRINNNRWPSTTAASKSERTLGEWLHNQRKYYQTGSNPAFTTERAAYLDGVLPGWRKR